MVRDYPGVVRRNGCGGPNEMGTCQPAHLVHPVVPLRQAVGSGSGASCALPETHLPKAFFRFLFVP